MLFRLDCCHLYSEWWGGAVIQRFNYAIYLIFFIIKHLFKLNDTRVIHANTHKGIIIVNIIFFISQVRANFLCSCCWHHRKIANFTQMIWFLPLNIELFCMCLLSLLYKILNWSRHQGRCSYLGYIHYFD